MTENETIVQRTPAQQESDLQDLAALWSVQGTSVRQIAAELRIPKTAAGNLVQLGMARARARVSVTGVKLTWPGLPDASPAMPEGETPRDPFASGESGEEGPGVPQNPAPSVQEEDPSPQPEIAQEAPSPEAAWPMTQDEMKHLARTFKASHYEPETWPHWAKKLEIAIDPKACLAMEKLFPDKGHRDGVVYEGIMEAIHTGRNSLWKWTGVNLSFVLPQHKLFVWCQMDGDGKTMEIKFVRHDER